MKRYLTPWNVLGGLLFVLGLWAFFYAGRVPPTRVVNPPAQVVTPEERPRQVELKLYFAGEKGFTLERRRVELKPFESALKRAIVELVKGPDVAGAVPLLPPGSPPPAVFQSGRVVVLNLPASYRELGYGVRGESFLLYGLANTALANSDAEEVRFLLDGKPAMALIHLSLLDPIRRAK